jgi:hypothetical protein
MLSVNGREEPEKLPETRSLLESLEIPLNRFPLNAKDVTTLVFEALRQSVGETGRQFLEILSSLFVGFDERCAALVYDTVWHVFDHH